MLIIIVIIIIKSIALQRVKYVDRLYLVECFKTYFPLEAE